MGFVRPTHGVPPSHSTRTRCNAMLRNATRIGNIGPPHASRAARPSRARLQSARLRAIRPKAIANSLFHRHNGFVRPVLCPDRTRSPHAQKRTMMHKNAQFCLNYEANPIAPVSAIPTSQCHRAPPRTNPHADRARAVPSAHRPPQAAYSSVSFYKLFTSAKPVHLSPRRKL